MDTEHSMHVVDRQLFRAVTRAIDPKHKAGNWVEVDRDGNGFINFPEFVEWARNHGVKLPEDPPSSLTLLETLAKKSGHCHERIKATEFLEDAAPHLAPGCALKLVTDGTSDAAASEPTTFKSILLEKVPVIVELEQFLLARQYLRMYGMDRLRAELEDFVDENGEMAIGTKPFNFFARVGANVLPKMDEFAERDFEKNQAALGPYAKDFIVIQNQKQRQRKTVVTTHRQVDREGRKEDTKGKAGMSLRHDFLVPRKRHWQFMNILSLGLIKGGPGSAEVMEFLQTMQDAAQYYTRNASAAWSGNVGMFFHCYPNTGVLFLHMHIVDMDALGPTFEALKDRNLDIRVAMSAFQAEVDRDFNAQIEAATTTEFQNLHRSLDSTLRRAYTEKYFEKFSPSQKEKMRRNRLYNTTPMLWRRPPEPFDRMVENRAMTPSRRPGSPWSSLYSSDTQS
jgi:Ca2+-binding EF-hand superfamily protein